MNNSYILRSSLPAVWPSRRWKDAFVSGNGVCGISVYGSVKRETILVNHGRLWHWGKRGNLPDISGAFAETRAYLKKGEYKKANPCIAEALIQSGYESQLAVPCPVGDISIITDAEGEFSSYERSLDMESGEVTVAWELSEIFYKRRTFVSRTRDVIVLLLEASEPELAAYITVQLHETGGEDTVQMKKESTVSCYEQNNHFVYEVETDQKEHFGLAGRVIECDGEAVISGDGIRVSNARKICVVFHVFGKMASVATASGSEDYLDNLNGDYRSLLEEHKAEHIKLFHNAVMHLGNKEGKRHSVLRGTEELLYDTYRGNISDEMCELLWNYGRYLFISGTRPDALPFQMYGLWGGEYRLVWSHYMANINIQMMYWHCITGGYADYVRSFIDYYTGLMPDFRENAKKVFGLDGIYVPAGTTPGYGLMNQIVPVITNWIGAAGWISQHMVEYYLAERDDEMLEKKILPFMEQAALFYEQYLVKENGKLQVYPSVSPENTPGNLQSDSLRHMSHPCPTAKNATMDIAILKEFFTNLVLLSEMKHWNMKKTAGWKKIVEELPSYEVNEDGAVKEWIEEDLQDFYYHRHLSHLYPVFPGKEFMDREDFPLKDAFGKAVELRVQGGQSGWSLVQLASVYARLGKGDRALKCLEILARSCLTFNFFTLHNDWKDMGLTLDLYQSKVTDKAPVQLDASIGIVNVIQELLLQYSENFLSILPALPKKWNTGSVRGFHFYGGSIDMEWNDEGRKCKCVIQSIRDQKLAVKFPTNMSGEKILVKQNGDQFVTDLEEIQRIDLKAGDRVVLEIR